MSRQLPPNPNLEHLKKQAKELLRELQQRDPGMKLSDAQHLIAREYGFVSWPKLKAHVESLAAMEKPNPFVGIWMADLSKSRRHPANQFQSATLQFEVVGDTVTIADIVVDASGREYQSRNTVRADGIERLSENGYLMMMRWRGSHILETVAKKDGQIVGRGTYEVSADGRTLTVSADEQVIVMDRQ
jgi:hypothetical protein